MRALRTVLALTCLAAPATVSAQAGQCRLTGSHVSGVVSVDLQNGSRAEIPLVDVAASLEMSGELEQVRVSVTAPLVFEGTLVAGGRGGPGVYAARALRTPDRAIALAPNVTVEARPSASPDQVTLRAPLDWGNGWLELDVPCAGLSVGAPRAGMTAPRPVMRGEFLSLSPDLPIRRTATADGARIAHLVANAGAERLTVRGTMGRPANGFVRVSLHVGAITVEGFVPEGSVSSAGRDLVPPGASINQLGVSASLDDAERESRDVTLAAGTEVFADPLAAVPWARVASPMRATLTRRTGSRQRFALVLSHAAVPSYPCRFDAVPGLPSCGDSAALPRVGVLRCADGRCTQIAYVEEP